MYKKHRQNHEDAAVAQADNTFDSKIVDSVIEKLTLEANAIESACNELCDKNIKKRKCKKKKYKVLNSLK